jgi:hypothetical protein
MLRKAGRVRETNRLASDDDASCRAVQRFRAGGAAFFLDAFLAAAGFVVRAATPLAHMAGRRLRAPPVVASSGVSSGVPGRFGGSIVASAAPGLLTGPGIAAFGGNSSTIVAASASTAAACSCCGVSSSSGVPGRFGGSIVASADARRPLRRSKLEVQPSLHIISRYRWYSSFESSAQCSSVTVEVEVESPPRRAWNREPDEHGLQVGLAHLRVRRGGGGCGGEGVEHARAAVVEKDDDHDAMEPALVVFRHLQLQQDLASAVWWPTLCAQGQTCAYRRLCTIIIRRIRGRIRRRRRRIDPQRVLILVERDVKLAQIAQIRTRKHQHRFVPRAKQNIRLVRRCADLSDVLCDESMQHVVTPLLLWFDWIAELDVLQALAAPPHEVLHPCDARVLSRYGGGSMSLTSGQARGQIGGQRRGGRPADYGGVCTSRHRGDGIGSQNWASGGPTGGPTDEHEARCHRVHRRVRHICPFNYVAHVLCCCWIRPLARFQRQVEDSCDRGHELICITLRVLHVDDFVHRVLSLVVPGRHGLVADDAQVSGETVGADGPHISPPQPRRRRCWRGHRLNCMCARKKIRCESLKGSRAGLARASV